MKISKKIELNYNISFGKMSKWLTGLTEGFALALKCSLCEKVSFPPVSYTHLTLPTSG